MQSKPGYVEVLRSNPQFRLLFAARTISLLGDWFSLLATIALLREVAGSDAQALSGVLILRLIPIFFAGPVAGVVADRFSRRTIMIVADLTRAGLILAMIAAPLVPRPVGYVYLLTALLVVSSAFFEPARNAALPQVVRPRDLSAANALGAIVWSLTFTLGAALGGVVADLLGWRAALVIDAASYLISAGFVIRLVLPPRPERKTESLDWQTVTGIRDFRAGIGFIARRPAVATVIGVKAGWGIAGATTLFLTLFGERVYAIGGRPDLGVAMLLSARALGTGIGPVLARRLVVRESADALRWLLTGAFVWPIFWYLVFTWVDHAAIAATTIVLAHFGGSVLWVYSTVLLQRMVPDEFRGRVLSTDLGLATLTIAASTWAYGALADAPGTDLRVLMRWMSLSLLIPAAAWAVSAGRWKVDRAS